MIKFDKWYFPDGEKHLQGWMSGTNRRVDGRLTYQYGKYDTAKKYIKSRTMALDIGGHVGLWSYFLARDFKHVAAFEPCKEHAQCWYKNMEGIDNAELFEMALGDHAGKCALETRTPGSSGDTQINPGGKGKLDMAPLDDFDFEDIGFIKIDCEGYEEFILRGGENTLLSHKPCVIVEQKPHHSKRYGLKQNGAVAYLESLGAKVREVISGDYILSWD